MKNKNILFIYAHLDDETIISYGTILKFAKDNNINIAILSGKGRGKAISKNIAQQKLRKQVFKDNCKQFNYQLFNHNDITLTQDIVKKEVSKYISSIKPDIVFTHFTNDLHYEHRMVAEEVLLACRRNDNSDIQALYMSASPTIMQTYGTHNQQFNPNYFVDISEYVDQKKIALQKYNMELPSNDNDIRSIESILAQNRQYGRLMNTKYCEAYQQVFMLN